MEVVQRDPHVAVTDIGADGVGRGPVQRERLGRPPHRSVLRIGWAVLLAHEPGRDHVDDQGRDGGTRQTGHSGQLGPARPGAVVKRLENAQAALFPEVHRCGDGGLPPCWVARRSAMRR